MMGKRPVELREQKMMTLMIDELILELIHLINGTIWKSRWHRKWFIHLPEACLNGKSNANRHVMWSQRLNMAFLGSQTGKNPFIFGLIKALKWDIKDGSILKVWGQNIAPLMKEQVKAFSIKIGNWAAEKEEAWLN